MCKDNIVCRYQLKLDDEWVEPDSSTHAGIDTVTKERNDSDFSIHSKAPCGYRPRGCFRPSLKWGWVLKWGWGGAKHPPSFPPPSLRFQNQIDALSHSLTVRYYDTAIFLRQNIVYLFFLHRRYHYQFRTMSISETECFFLSRSVLSLEQLLGTFFKFRKEMQTVINSCIDDKWKRISCSSSVMCFSTFLSVIFLNRNVPFKEKLWKSANCDIWIGCGSLPSNAPPTTLLCQINAAVATAVADDRLEIFLSIRISSLSLSVSVSVSIFRSTWSRAN